MVRFSTYCLLASATLFGFAGFVLPEIAAPRAYTYLLAGAGATFLLVGIVAWYNEEPLY